MKSRLNIRRKIISAATTLIAIAAIGFGVHATPANAAVPASSATQASAQDVADPTTSYDPGTDGWTAGDPFATPTAPVDPTTSYDPGTDGWTLGDPFAGSYSYDYSY